MTDTVQIPSVGEEVIADRKRRGLSRRAYATLIGTTEAKLANIEKGKKPVPEVWVLLQPMIADLIDGTAPPPAQEPTAAELPAPKAKAVKPPKVSPAASIDDRVVYLLTYEELEDDLPDDVVLGSGLAERYDFKYPGYHISNGELRTFKECKRKWWLAYYRELQPKVERPTGPAAIGTRIHIALSAMYGFKEDPFAVLEATIESDREALAARQDIEGLDVLEKEADLARAMLEGYLEWLRETGIDEGLTVVGNEEVVEVPFLEASPATNDVPVVLVGKLDLRLVRSIDQARLFLDHKSVGSLTEPLKWLHMDEQMLHYHLLEKLSAPGGEHTMGGLYNMLKKVKRGAAAKPPFFDRAEIHHNTHELENYAKRVTGEVIDIMSLRANLDAGYDHQIVAYPTPTRDCSWKCPYYYVCPMFDDGSRVEDMLAIHFVASDPHDHYRPYGHDTQGE